MPRLTLALPEEFGPTGEGGQSPASGEVPGSECADKPQIARWAACLAGCCHE